MIRYDTLKGSNSRDPRRVLEESRKNFSYMIDFLATGAHQIQIVAQYLASDFVFY